MRSVRTNGASRKLQREHDDPCSLGQDGICRAGNLSLLGASIALAACAQTAHGDSSGKL